MKDIQKYFDSREMANLVEEYGTPMILNDSGQVTGVNQQCFAAMFEKIYKPIFETTEDCFYLYGPSTGLWMVTSKEVLMNKLSLLMKDYASLLCKGRPTPMPDFLFNQLETNDLRKRTPIFGENR